MAILNCNFRMVWLEIEVWNYVFFDWRMVRVCSKVARLWAVEVQMVEWRQRLGLRLGLVLLVLLLMRLGKWVEQLGRLVGMG